MTTVPPHRDADVSVDQRMRLARSVGALGVALLLQACNTGAGGDGYERGRFVDATVSGLAYQTVASGLAGFTDDGGRFAYAAGESVTFSVANALIGTTIGDAVVTPVDLAPGNNTRILNIARLLQSLDADQDLDNGIDLAAAVREATVSAIDFSQPTESFGNQPGVQDLLATAGGSRTLVSPEAAEAHLRDSMVEAGEEDPGDLNPTPSPTGAPTPSPSGAPTPTPSSAPTPVPSGAPTPAPSGAPTPTPSSIPTPTPAATATPTPAPTSPLCGIPILGSLCPTPTPAPSATPQPTPTTTPAPSGTPVPTPTGTPTGTPGPTPSSSASPTPSATPTPTTGPTPVPGAAVPIYMMFNRRLVKFMSDAPQTLLQDVEFNGGSECGEFDASYVTPNFFDIAFDRSTGQLYGMSLSLRDGESARLCAIDKNTGTASNPVVISDATMGDMAGGRYIFDFTPDGTELRVVNYAEGEQLRLRKNGSLVARDTDMYRDTSGEGDSDCNPASNIPTEVYGIAYDCAAGLPTVYTVTNCDQTSGSIPGSDVLFTVGSKNGSPQSPNGGLLLPVGLSPSNRGGSAVHSLSVDILNQRAFYMSTVDGFLLYHDLNTGALTEVGLVGFENAQNIALTAIAVDNGSTVCR